MSNNNGMEALGDMVIEGFERLDPKVVIPRPPKIKWSEKFYKLDAEARAEYLGKLANTMNHAAYLIQQQRDELNDLCEKKEGQIDTLKRAMEQNMTMLQSEVDHMNKQRQEYHANIKRLNAKIRSLSHMVEELTGGNND